MALALLLIAFVFAVLTMLNVTVPRINTLGAAITFWIASLLIGHVAF